MFVMSFFEVLKGVLKKIDYFRSRFFWQNDQEKMKYRLVKWGIVCQPKEQGVRSDRLAFTESMFVDKVVG